MEKIPQPVVPQEMLDHPFTVGPMKAKLEEDLYVNVGIDIEVRKPGQKPKKQHLALRARVESLFTPPSTGVPSVVVHIVDPRKPRDMYEQQVVRQTLLLRSDIERVEKAMKLLASVA